MDITSLKNCPCIYTVQGKHYLGKRLKASKPDPLSGSTTPSLDASWYLNASVLQHKTVVLHHGMEQNKENSGYFSATDGFWR